MHLEGSELTILLMIGISVLAGLAGAKASERVRIPMVVGYIVAGVIFGDSGFKIINASSTKLLTDIALGFIGFGIGSQLKYSTLRRLGSSIISISILEAVGAFLLVGLGVWLLSGHIYMGLIFGALASATAPAATVDVLEEYHSRGPLTSSLLAVVGIDDGIAILLFGFGISIAQNLLDGGGSIAAGLIKPLIEISGSIAAGIILGFIFSRISKLMQSKSEMLILSAGMVVTACGIANHLGLSLIMTNMIIGVTICNMTPLRVQRIQDAVQGFSPPIYVLFFVLAGARLNIGLIPKMGLLGVIYIVLRACGKFGGAYLGASISKAPDVVRKYLGFGLLSQAGVAVGLSLAAADILNTPETRELGDLVINVIAATTFIVQIAGPPLTKYAIIKAGEVPPEQLERLKGKSKREEDET